MDVECRRGNNVSTFLSRHGRFRAGRIVDDDISLDRWLQGSAGRPFARIDRLAQRKSWEGLNRINRGRKRGPGADDRNPEQTETKNRIVEYRGGAPAVTDLLGGQLISSASRHHRLFPCSGRTAQVFGVAAKKRWFAAPDVPTIAEIGGPNIDVPFWHGPWAPKGASKEIITRSTRSDRRAWRTRSYKNVLPISVTRFRAVIKDA